MYEYIQDRGHSVDIMAFGSGGDLAQNVNRDTLGMAIKCSYIEVDWKGRDVFKDPVTDRSKASKKGMLDLFYVDGEYVTANVGDYDPKFSKLNVIYRNGEVFMKDDFKIIRGRF